MTEKNKRKARPKQMFKNMMLFIAGISMFGLFMIFSPYLAVILPETLEKTRAQMQVNTLRFENLPPDSEFIEFRTGRTGGSGCCLESATMEFTSELPLQQILDFYELDNIGWCELSYQDFEDGSRVYYRQRCASWYMRW